MNKRGELGEYGFLFYLVFVLLIVVGGIAASVIMFFGGGFDGRQAQADLVFMRIQKCLIDKPFSETDFYSQCGVSKQTLMENYAYEIKREDKILMSYNNPTLCGLNGIGKSDYPRCRTATFTGKDGKYGLIVGSLQKVRRVSV